MSYFSRGMRIYSRIDGDLSSEWPFLDGELRNLGSCPVCELPRHALIPMDVSDEDAGICMCPKPTTGPEGQREQDDAQNQANHSQISYQVLSDVATEQS